MTIRQLWLRSFVLSALAAVGLIGLRYVDWPTEGIVAWMVVIFGTALSLFLTPGILVAFFFSKNVHEPNVIVTVLVTALFWSSLISAVVARRRKVLQRSPSRPIP